MRRNFFLGLGLFAYHASKRYNKVVRQNLKFIYGKDVSEEFVEEISRYSFKQLLLNFLHTMESRYYSAEDILKDVTFQNKEVVEKAKAQNRPIVFVTAHYGSWELGGAMISTFIEPLMIVYKKMKNPYFENYLLSSRKKSRITYIQRRGATKGLLKQLRSGGSIALLIDTNIRKDEGIVVDFLNHPTTQIKTTAFFARKFDAAIIPVLIHTQDDIKYTITFYDEIVPPKTDDEASDIKVSTQMQTDWLSKEILKEPKPWFWLHRRWKNDYPEAYES